MDVGRHGSVAPVPEQFADERQPCDDESHTERSAVSAGGPEKCFRVALPTSWGTNTSGSGRFVSFSRSSRANANFDPIRGRIGRVSRVRVRPPSTGPRGVASDQDQRPERQLDPERAQKRRRDGRFQEASIGRCRRQMRVRLSRPGQTNAGTLRQGPDNERCAGVSGCGLRQGWRDVRRTGENVVCRRKECVRMAAPMRVPNGVRTVDRQRHQDVW